MTQEQKLHTISVLQDLMSIVGEYRPDDREYLAEYPMIDAEIDSAISDAEKAIKWLES